MWRRVQGLQDKCWQGIWSNELSEFCWKFCRFHSYCVDLTPEQVTNMDKYTCASCAPENHKRASGPSSHKTPDMKVINAWYFSRVICLWLQFPVSTPLEQLMASDCYSQVDQEKGIGTILLKPGIILTIFEIKSTSHTLNWLSSSASHFMMVVCSFIQC